MEKRVIFLLASTALLLSVFVDTSTSSLFSSLSFTRESLMDFSSGSERTVEILTPKKTTKTVVNSKETKAKLAVKKFGLKRPAVSTGILVPKWTGGRPGATQKPVTQTVITYQKKRKTYRPRSSPSNKFLEAINDIERAVANARASGVSYSEATLTKLKALLLRAIRSKSYKYAREVLGQIMYLLSTKSSSPGRLRRTSQNEGGKFLRGLRQQIGSSTFDSFMAVQGDVSLMFVIDDTGSMGNEIQATKNIAIDIINYPRQAPVEYILSPFNDPYPGMRRKF